MIFHDVSIHFFSAVLIAIGIALVLVFTSHTLLRYIKYRNQPALYLTLNYVCYIAALIIFFIGQAEVVITGMEDQIFIDLAMFANVFILLGMVLAILLYDQFSKLKSWIKYTSITLGFLLSGFVLMQFFLIGYESLPLRISIYILMTLYAFAIYGSLTVLFYQAFRKTEEKKRELGALVIGNFLWVVHFVLRVIYGINNIDIVEFIANLMMIFIFICYFLGLFLFPKQKRVG